MTRDGLHNLSDRLCQRSPIFPPGNAREGFRPGQPPKNSQRPAQPDNAENDRRKRQKHTGSHRYRSLKRG